MSAELQVFEDYEPYVGEDFVLPGDEGGEHPPIAFTLVEAKLIPSNFPDAVRPAFMLVFRVASRQVFEQGNYLLTHPKVGERVIFLVASGQDAEGTEYCATYN